MSHSAAHLLATTEYDPDFSVFHTHRDVGRAGADAIARLVQKKPNAVLGMATGGTMEPLYMELVRAHHQGLDLSQARFFNLDEYIGLPPEHLQSYHAYMRHHLFDPINACPENCHIPDGMNPNTAAVCAAYEDAIYTSGGIDLQILGIGENGHIGFCEPGTAFNTRTHKTRLTRETRQTNARYFSSPDDVPTHAITMGLGTILDARQILLLASGEAKARAVNALLTHPLTTDIPATILRRHPRVELCLDRAAFSLVATNAVQPLPGCNLS